MPRDLKKNSTASLHKSLLCHKIFKKKKEKKKKESFPFKHRFTNIDSQNHKHKLRFERGHEPKKIKKIKEPKKNIGELGPPRLYLRSRTPTRPLSISDHQDLR